MPSVAQLQLGGRDYFVTFDEHDHGAHDHSSAHLDTTCGPLSCTCWLAPLVSVMVIVGLLLARAFGWLWMDPLAGIIGACVIANRSWGLIRDTGAILLDMVPDRRVAERVRGVVEAEGGSGPGHLGAILSVNTAEDRGPAFYRERLARFPALSHVTVEVQRSAA
jgi:Co/Zn/Cd efflux system component